MVMANNQIEAVTVMEAPQAMVAVEPLAEAVVGVDMGKYYH